jgi:hypothetical protein
MIALFSLVKGKIFPVRKELLQQSQFFFTVGMGSIFPSENIPGKITSGCTWYLPGLLCSLCFLKLIQSINY